MGWGQILCPYLWVHYNALHGQKVLKHLQIFFQTSGPLCHQCTEKQPDSKKNTMYSPIYQRPLNGDKGIGRFSVDRLGSFLHMEAQKRGSTKRSMSIT